MENFDNDEKEKIENREHQRYSVPAMVTCTFLEESLRGKSSLEMAVELDLPDGKHRLNFSGVIRWQKRVKKNNMSFLYLGIQFYDLKESDRNVLKKYLSLGTGDKNLIWNLWDNILMQP